MKRLLYIIDEWGLKGGAHIATELLIAALQKRGYTVNVMQAIPRNSFWGIIHRAYARMCSLLPLSTSTRLNSYPLFLRDPFGFKFRQMKRYDTVCVMSETSVLKPIVARLPPNVRKVQLIHTNYPMWAKLVKRDIAADAKLFVQFDCIACVGTIGAKQFEEMFPECKGKVVPFHNIIEVERGEPCRGGEVENGDNSTVQPLTFNLQPRTLDRRAMAEKKVAEWLDGVDAATFDVALRNLVEEKAAAGEYVFENQECKKVAIDWARKFFCEFSRKLIPLSDGRLVYFVPDVRARDREISNARAWAEYAFHAVSTGGKQVPGKSYFIRHFSDAKCENLAQVESTIRAEHCVAIIERDRPERDAIHFVGISTRDRRFDVVTRLDEYGNANANLSEVTVVMTRKKYSEKNPPPEFRPLTEVVEAVAKHQAAGFSPSTTGDSIANPPSPRKGGNENSSLQLQLETTTKSDNSTVHLHLSPSPRTPVRLISLARINDAVAKDGPRMIRVAKRLKDAGLDFVWDNYGGSGNGFVACQQEVERLGLGDVFRIHPFDPNASAKIAEADVFVLLSHYEGLPNVIYESLLAGTPVFATSVGGIPEQIQDGVNGWLVADDADAIVNRLSSVLKDRDAIGAARDAALRFQYDNDKIVDEHLEFLS